MPVNRALFLAPFDELADPQLLADLAARAEARGWDGFFLWDHIRYAPPVRAVLDPWVAMSAIACATERIRIGALVTPIPRRRVHKLARETVTLDLLSRGRLTFGAGIGSDYSGELSGFGEELDDRTRGDMLDDGLAKLQAYWDGEFEPRPVQQPRIPVWLAAKWPNRKPLRRAARWDGFFPIYMPGVDEFAEMAAEVRELRNGDEAPFDLVVTNPPGTDLGPWAAAGATWCLTGFDAEPRRDVVESVIEEGP